MKEKVMQGKPYAGNPHVRFDEGAGAPRHSGRSALLYENSDGIAWFLGKLVKAACEKRAESIFGKWFPSKKVKGKLPRANVNRPAPAVVSNGSTAAEKSRNAIVGPMSGKTMSGGDYSIDLNMKFNPEEFAEVYDFYRDIAPAIRMRELGVNKLSRRDREAFELLQSTPVYWAKLPPRVGGLTQKQYKRILLSATNPGNDKRVTLAHELRHMLATMIPLNDRSARLLQNTYGFNGVEIKPGDPNYSKEKSIEEMFTTNKEHQFKSYLELRNSLGRKPTSQEFFKYLDAQRNDPKKIESDRRAFDNVYQQRADESMGREAVGKTIWDYLNVKQSVSRAARIVRGYLPEYLSLKGGLS